MNTRRRTNTPSHRWPCSCCRSCRRCCPPGQTTANRRKCPAAAAPWSGRSSLCLPKSSFPGRCPRGGPGTCRWWHMLVGSSQRSPWEHRRFPSRTCTCTHPWNWKNWSVGGTRGFPSGSKSCWDSLFWYSRVRWLLRWKMILCPRNLQGTSI